MTHSLQLTLAHWSVRLVVICFATILATSCGEPAYSSFEECFESEKREQIRNHGMLPPEVEHQLWAWCTANPDVIRVEGEWRTTEFYSEGRYTRSELEAAIERANTAGDVAAVQELSNVLNGPSETPEGVIGSIIAAQAHEGGHTSYERRLLSLIERMREKLKLIPHPAVGDM